MKKFEYCEAPREDISLIEMGKQGWELCAIHQSVWVFKREVSNIDYAGLLIACSFRRGVPQLQHRTIAEFAQFVEDVMSNKKEYEKYKFDINSTDDIRTWIEKFHEYCKEYYSNLEKEFPEV